MLPKRVLAHGDVDATDGVGGGVAAGTGNDTASARVGVSAGGRGGVASGASNATDSAGVVASASAGAHGWR